MPSFCQLPHTLDVSPLREALKAQPHLFGQYKLRGTAYQSPHGQMTDIWVRYNDIKNLDPSNPAVFNEEHDSVWYPVVEQIPQVKPLVFDVMAMTDGERLGGVLITKLPPGGSIATHVDAGWHASYYEKFYLPIENEPGAVFGFPEGVIAPRPGSVYWFRNDVPHWVRNDSNADRIAMIVCIKTDRFKGMRA